MLSIETKKRIEEKRRQKIRDLYAQGKWYKCAREGCNNPAGRNREGSCCSRKCRYIHENLFEKLNEAKKKFYAKHPGYRKKFMDDECKKKISDGTLKFLRENPEFLVKRNLAIAAVRIKKSYKDRMKLIWTLNKIEKEKNKVNEFYVSSKGKDLKGNNRLPCLNETYKKIFTKLDENPEVLSWNYKTVQILYDRAKDIGKWIIPDLEIIYKDNFKKIVEIKENGLEMNGIESIIRFRAIQDYCIKNNYLYEVWNE